MRKIVTLLIVATLLSSTPVFAKDPDKEYQQWLKSFKKEYKSYVDEYDQEFSSFLKNNWVKTEVSDAKQRDQRPKPVELPVAKPKPVVDKRPVTVSVKPQPAAKPKPIVKTQPIQKPKPFPTSKKQTDVVDPFDFSNGIKPLTLNWLGNKIIMPKMDVVPLKVATFDSQIISSAWLDMAKRQFRPALIALEQAKKKLNLDDWGQAIFTYSYIKSHKALTVNDTRLFTWFFLVKQGFDTRVAFKDQDLYLMLAAKQTLYGRKYFTLDNKRFYFIDLATKQAVNVGSVYTYNKQHASAKNAFAIDLAKVPTQSASDSKRALATEINGKEVVINASYNKGYVEFLDYYPQLEMKYYFKAELPEQTKDELLSQLRVQLQGKSELESLNFLLHFVQSSLAYQTDQEQFNVENYLVAVETIHYPYADCEDRSVLFAYLVKHLLGNDIVGVQYDGHIATAVKIASPMKGDSYKINGETYWVADPTYINANVGTVMPQYKRKRVQFVVY